MEMKLNTSVLVKLALLVAISILLTRFASFRLMIGPVEGVRLGFGVFPVVFAGLMFGPLAGCMVGVVADLAGYFIDPVKTGAFLPQLTVVAGLHGIIPPLVASVFGAKRRNSLMAVTTAVGIDAFLATLVMVPIIIQMAFGIPYIIALPARLISFAIQTPLYVMVMMIMLKRMAPWQSEFKYRHVENGAIGTK